MQRRSFLKKAGIATASMFAAPYILPSGRLFAATGTRKVNHVVFCLYAGGVRSFESIDKAEGNLMKTMLQGSESISADIAAGMSALPSSSPLPQPLQNYATFYKGFRYNQGPTGHYSAHTAAMTGVYTANNLDLKTHPPTPTIFEFYRKHTSPTKNALNAWWVANTLGPYPALNYSNYPGYGAMYGANFVCPNALISSDTYDVLGDMRMFNSKEQAAITNMRDFMDKNFTIANSGSGGGVTNPEPDFTTLQTFVADTFNKAVAGQYNNPWNIPSGMSNDMSNVFFAEEIIKKFTPELLVVNMQDVDVCHSDFTQYCNNLRKADYAVSHLWNTIQNTPGMANDTIMIVLPEHGRNKDPNSLVDAYGRNALDHTGDDVSRKIFCMVVGPTGVINQNQVIATTTGESIDIAPTIANILGFDTDIPSGMLSGRILNEAYV